jgi:RND family efflux transporter MFP subunit
VETSEPLRQASEATVREIAPTAGGVARTRRVRLTLTDPPETFLLGATVDIAWQVPLATPAAIVPSTAILAKDGKSFVWLVDKAASTVAAREVETNSAGTTSTSITSGINDGDTIVVVGVNSLTEGQTVSLGAGEGK